MPAPDPLAALGLGPGATADDIRDARRRLAKTHHPDQGGDSDQMRTINEAADAALADVRTETVEPAASERPVHEPRTPHEPEQQPEQGVSRYARDAPSFTVEALPVETFEAMLVVASWMGEVLDDEPPYRLETYLAEPYDCWCRLDVVPDAGASTVSLTVGGLDGAPAPDVLSVRDAWVNNLNTVDWPDV